jgi:hypothetical protein
MLENIDEQFDAPPNNTPNKLDSQQIGKILLKGVLPGLAIAVLALGIGWAVPYLISLKFGTPFSLKATWITLLPGLFFFLRVFWRVVDIVIGKIHTAEGTITILTPPSYSRDGSFEINRKIIFVDKRLCKTRLQERKKYRVTYLPLSKLALSIRQVEERVENKPAPGST